MYPVRRRSNSVANFESSFGITLELLIVWPIFPVLTAAGIGLALCFILMGSHLPEQAACVDILP
jgi:hypothetical protein